MTFSQSSWENKCTYLQDTALSRDIHEVRWPQWDHVTHPDQFHFHSSKEMCTCTSDFLSNNHSHVEVSAISSNKKITTLLEVCTLSKYCQQPTIFHCFLSHFVFPQHLHQKILPLILLIYNDQTNEMKESVHEHITFDRLW